MVWPNTSSAHWQFMAPAVVDNYYTRRHADPARTMPVGAPPPRHMPQIR